MPISILLFLHQFLACLNRKDSPVPKYRCCIPRSSLSFLNKWQKNKLTDHKKSKKTEKKFAIFKNENYLFEMA